VRGSEQVAGRLQAAIAQHGLQDHVDIVGTFCLEHCSMGVTLKIGDQIFEAVDPEGVDAFFEREVLARVESVAVNA
jgi:NADH:ubiquinone oxidoreductase subunit E